MKNCTCEDDSSKVCKQCFNNCQNELNKCKNELNEFKILCNNDSLKKEGDLEKLYQEAIKSGNDIISLKTQFYTVIGFLLIVTTSITSAVAFYSKEIPAIILENSALKNNILSPVLYFGAPMLLVFFTFFCSIWFYKSLSGSNAHPFWNALSLSSKTIFFQIVNLSFFFAVFSICMYTFRFISATFPSIKYGYITIAIGIIAITVDNILFKLFKKILKIIRKI